MNGIIVIEGPDGSGKTTLARRLERDYGAVYFHQSWSKEWDIFQYFTERLMEAAKLSQTRLVVLDRLWVSELVYGMVYRGGSKWPLIGRFVDRVILKHAGINLFCLANPETAAARHEKMKTERPEMFSDGAEKVAAAYVNVSIGDSSPVAVDVGCGPMLSRPDVVTYSIEGEGRDPGAFLAGLVDKLGRWRAQQYQPALTDRQNVLGHLAMADTLFVGDRTNPKVEGLNWPFYEYGNCSLHLAKALALAGWPEVRGMWTNASDPDSHLEGLLKAKEWRAVVALGTNAADRLDELGAKCWIVDHPQYSRRFGADAESYSRQLRPALF